MMNALGITQDAMISSLEVKLNAEYTDEQKNLLTAFGDGPVFCFADPGTGKTFTAVGGLLNAELFKGIPGDNIYALSFTRLATAELATRHGKACEKLGIVRTVHFATLHSLCRSILKDNYKLLGMSSFDSSGAMPMAKAISLVVGSANEMNIAMDNNKARRVIQACNTLNAALIFDEDAVKSKAAFKDAHCDYETFDKVRGLLYAYNLLTETVTVSDMLLYTLMLMERHPEISQNFKAKCKLMLIDEAQDLSLLQLRVISMLTDNPVCIGDMKQQIYAFNGACQEIVPSFNRLYPGSSHLELTQSFRCKNEIANYATQIILHNKVGGENYRGVGPGGFVKVLNGIEEDGADIAGLCKNLREEYLTNGRRLLKEYLFLVRNNISLTPILEEMFKNELPFRVNKFTPAYEMPVIKDLCELLQLVQFPDNPSNILALRYVIPEFSSYYSVENHPFTKIMRKTGYNIFEINYEFKDIGMGSRAMMMLMEIQEMLDAQAPMKDIFNRMWPIYESVWLADNAWKLEYEPDYYLQNVSCLVHKNYADFIQDEAKKKAVIEESERYGRGVRCYTMHASKGLEADIVYIIDADEGLIPNMSKINKMVKKGCELDAARAVREERSLCYVACTRAKEQLYIVHNGKPSPMIMGENPYQGYDNFYQWNLSPSDDITAFTQFTNKYVQQL